jgi:hypothetical protein
MCYSFLASQTVVPAMQGMQGGRGDGKNAGKEKNGIASYENARSGTTNREVVERHGRGAIRCGYMIAPTFARIRLTISQAEINFFLQEIEYNVV